MNYRNGLRTRLGHLAGQQTEIRELIDTSLASGVPRALPDRGGIPVLIEEEYRLALAEAESAFVGRLIQRITNPATGWIDQWAEFHHEKAPTPEGE